MSTKEREPAPVEVPLTRVGVITYDVGGRCTWANVVAAELLSISREALLGQDLRGSDFWRDSGLLPHVEAALAGVPGSAVISVEGAQGGPRHLEVRLEQLTVAGQLMLLAVLADVTPLLSLESALRGSRERFRELVDVT